MIPVACKLFLRDHPEVNYKPGPFNPGRKLGAFCNVIAITWTCFAVTILVSSQLDVNQWKRFLTKIAIVLQIMPTIRPVTADNMNYASVITVGVMALAGLWYLVSARKYYNGPRKTLPEKGGSVNSDDDSLGLDDIQDKKERPSPSP